MAFRVEIAPWVFSDLDGIAADIKEHGSNKSDRGWFSGIIGAIGSSRQHAEPVSSRRGIGASSVGIDNKTW